MSRQFFILPSLIQYLMGLINFISLLMHMDTTDFFVSYPIPTKKGFLIQSEIRESQTQPIKYTNI